MLSLGLPLKIASRSHRLGRRWGRKRLHHLVDLGVEVSLLMCQRPADYRSDLVGRDRPGQRGELNLVLVLEEMEVGVLAPEYRAG